MRMLLRSRRINRVSVSPDRKDKKAAPYTTTTPVGGGGGDQKKGNVGDDG
jgi:hypothetical protein